MAEENAGTLYSEITFPPIEGKLILVIDLAEGVDAEDLATDVNAEIMFRLLEDDKKITHWEWIY